MNKKTNKPDHLMLNKHAKDQFQILVVPATMAVETATNFSSLKNRLEKSDRYAKKNEQPPKYRRLRSYELKYAHTRQKSKL